MTLQLYRVLPDGSRRPIQPLPHSRASCELVKGEACEIRRTDVPAPGGTVCATVVFVADGPTATFEVWYSFRRARPVTLSAEFNDTLTISDDCDHAIGQLVMRDQHVAVLQLLPSVL